MVTGFQGSTFFIQTFGCQMNKHDTERIIGMLDSLGSTEVQTPEEADFVIFMTCCVRESADTRLYGQASSIKSIPIRKDSPFGKRILAIGGCIGQRDGEHLKDHVRNVDVVFGTFNVASLPKLLRDATKDNDGHFETLDEAKELTTDLPTVRKNDWAAWLPITVGCNNFCTYCIVPYVRGREISRSIEDIVAEAQKYVDEGVKEITLLGQNVNSYGRDLYGSPRFAEILDAVHDTGIERLRFATSHPKDLSDSVIERFATLDRLMPALHLPIQSGSNEILKAMNRRYTKEHYLELIDKLRSAVPNISLSTDVIVGFPGETKRDFEDTLDVINKVGYNQVFTFIYSPREGTPAAEMADETTHEEKQKRFEELFELVQAKALSANKVDEGSTVPVLIEEVSKKDPSKVTGRTPKNQTVHMKIADNTNPNDLIGNIRDVHINESKTWYLNGTFV